MIVLEYKGLEWTLVGIVIHGHTHNCETQHKNSG